MHLTSSPSTVRSTQASINNTSNMVAIRRTPLRRPQAAGSTSHGGGVLRSLCTFRNAILAIIMIQGVRLVSRVSLFGNSSNSNDSSNNNNNPLEQALKDSKNKLRVRTNPSKVKGGASKPLTPRRQDLDTHKRMQDRQEHPLPPQSKLEKHDLEALQKNMREHELSQEHDEHSEHEANEAQAQQHDDPHESNKDNHMDPPEHSSSESELKIHGSGPTVLGYTVDFALERQQPHYRLATDATTAVSQQQQQQQVGSKVEKLLSVQVQACESVSDEDHTLQWDPKCASPPPSDETQWAVYNGANFSRHVCGQRVAPGAALLVPTACHLSWTDDHVPDLRLWSSPITTSTLDMPPIVVTSTPDPVSSDKLTNVSCNVPCQWQTDLDTSHERRYIVGTPWKLTWTDADPAVFRPAQMQRTDHLHDHYYATTSWQSSVPLSSFSFDKYDFRRAPAIDFDSANDAASSVLNNHCSGTLIRRQKWMASAKANLDLVHYYGSCEHDAEVPNGKSLDIMQDRIDLMKQDRMVLAYEASTEKWHVTEIVWEALMSGAVPAILGASNLDGDILPKHAALYGANYNSWDQFSKLIQNVSSDKELWNSYQTWRTDETALTALETKLNFTRTDPQCRACRWAYAKKYGLGWDHGQQQVQMNHIERKLCLSSSSDQILVTQPFVESWLSEGDAALSTDKTTKLPESTCQEASSQMQFESLGLKRRVWHHDGFTDILVEPTSDNAPTTTAVLRLQVPVRNNEGALFRHVHTLVPDTLRSSHVSSAAIQDESSKVTILTNFEVDLESPAEGLVDVHISLEKSPGNRPRLLRIITEDFDVLHNKLTEYYPSSYAKMVVKDFVDPLDLFYAKS